MIVKLHASPQFPQLKDHILSYGFVATRTEDGRPLRILTLIDEYMRESLALKVAQSLRQKLSGTGLERLGVQTLFIELGSPWENGYNESFNGKLRDELLNGEVFTTLQ